VSLCVLCVLCASVFVLLQWLFNTETQRHRDTENTETQRHREHRDTEAQEHRELLARTIHAKVNGMSESRRSPRDNTAVPLLDLRTQYAAIREEIRAAIDRVADSQLFILGSEVEALESEIAQYSQCEFGVGVTSGTDALLVCLMVLDVKPGDEVILPSYSFFATAGSVVRLGARPVFVDIDPVTYNLDVSQVESLVNEKTKALMPVHLYGQMADMDPLMEIAQRRNIPVIEDAAQAIGAEYHGRRAGSIGDFGCLSFFPTKNLGGFGDGGMVTTNNRDLADRLKLYRNHGYAPRYYNKVVGGNFRLDALQAAVLRVKLKYLDGWTSRRQQNAARYKQLFEAAGLVVSSNPDRAHVVLPVDSGAGRHIYNQFVIRNGARDQLLAYLKERKIGAEIYYPVPLHLQECLADLGHRAGDFPHSEQAANETLALPIYPELTDEMIQTVVEAIEDFCTS
jgi:dTDP-4-amino-4,6-dideoxygalactose transaminase